MAAMKRRRRVAAMDPACRDPRGNGRRAMTVRPLQRISRLRSRAADTFRPPSDVASAMTRPSEHETDPAVALRCIVQVGGKPTTQRRG